jgi:hypothetical protein
MMNTEPQFAPACRSVETLGEFYYESKPKLENILAGMIIALILVVGGGALVAYMLWTLYLGGIPPIELDDKIAAHALVVVGILGACGGVYMFWRMWSLFSFRVRVYSDGFCVVDHGIERVFAWDEISHVNELILNERLPLVKGPAKALMPVKTSRCYSVVRCDGETFDFDANLLPSTSLLAGPLQTAAGQGKFDWHVSEETG